MNRTTGATHGPGVAVMPDPPSFTWRGTAIAAVAWCCYVLTSAVPLAATRGASFSTALKWQLGLNIVLAALSIPAWYIAIRRLHAARWYWRALAHAVIAPLYATAGYLYLYHSVRFFAGGDAAAPIQATAYWMIYQNILLYLVQFAVYHGYEILRTLRHKERLTLELLALTKEQELATLRAQMNPHFLFNTLNSISAMATVNGEETRQMVIRLADMLRYATGSATKPFVPLQQELTFVEDYLAIEQQRMGDRLSATVSADTELSAFPVPPMILQPIVENAVRHGLAPREDGGRVTVRVEKVGASITFFISDTGVGVTGGDPLANGTGVGLRNTDARLRKIYGEAAGVTIRSSPAAGTEVTFTLPGTGDTR